MSEMREYQQRLLRSESKIVMCNWKRGNGKTYSIIQKILQEGGDWVFITQNCYSKQNIIYDELSKNLRGRNLSYSLKINSNKIELIIVNGKTINIYFENPNTFRCSIRYDYVVFDDDKIDLEVIREAKTIRGLKQIVITTTMSDFEYISDDNKIEENINKHEWIEQQIKELMMEFSKIRKDERTTITREKILGMIRQLEDMRCV